MDLAKKTNLSHFQDKKGIVLVFLSPTCPICQKYTLTIKALQAQYPQLNWVGIFPKWVSKADIEAFNTRFTPEIPLLLDKKNRLVHRIGASITPEVFLLNPKGQILYSGAIDNWYVTPGQNRVQPSEFYLKNALEQYFSGYDISLKRTQPVGCIIEQH